ncbi:MAG: hypothetical protein GC188_10915 [Alphaproteobacteria bacterium]|nr:hypothetical protein [Alphaproteobacteria bacterium]
MRPTFSASGAGGLVAAVIVVFLLFRWQVPNDAVRDEVIVRFAEFYAAFTTFTAWSVLNFFVALGRASALVEKEGRWFGDHFIYNEPKLMAVVKTEPGKAQQITHRVPFVPIGVLLRYRAELAPENKFWQANLGFMSLHRPPKPHGAARASGLTGSCRVSQGKTVPIIITPTNTFADEAIIRFWIESWQI